MEPALKQIERLIAEIALGDRGAFERLYDATSAKLFGVTLRVLKERGEAEEALQDAYLRIWRGASRYSVTGLSPMAWLVTVARNAAIDRLRKRRSGIAAEPAEASQIDFMADPAPGPEALAAAAETRSRLQACLTELPEDRAEAVRAAYLEGYSYADLADRFGVPLNTMRTWLRRSLLKLRECLTR